MAIQERFFAMRYHIAFAAASAAAVFSLLRLGPSLTTVVGYFWPLFLSTGCFLSAVAVLLWISPPPASGDGDRAGEELIDFVAGRPQEAVAEGAEAAGDEAGRREEDEKAAEHGKSQ